MGKDIEENVVDKMENMLGLDEKKENEEQEKKVEENENAPKTHEDTTQEREEKHQKEETKPSLKTTTVTDEQITISKEIAKVDLQIEELQKQEVDVSSFYENIEDQLSEDELALEFNDKPAFMKLVAQKAKEYEDKNSPTQKIEELQKQKEELEAMNERQNAIVDVSKKYPDYNHEQLISFFENDLSKSEQQKIFDASKSYEDVYENTYKKYKTLNPQTVKSEEAPNIPNVDSVRRVSVNSKDVDSALKSEEEELKSALGL